MFGLDPRRQPGYHHQGKQTIVRHVISTGVAMLKNELTGPAALDAVASFGSGGARTP